MFEREIPDRREPQKKTKLIGWNTNTKTRDALLSEVRQAVREDRCVIRSIPTLKECRTLTVTRTPSGVERIEARSGCHDDGIFAYGIALIMRNRELPNVQFSKIPDDPEEVSAAVQSFLDDLTEPKPMRIPFGGSARRHIHGGRDLIDGRRNVL
jgi:hypothetical protein